jgi:spore germination protein YaaH
MRTRFLLFSILGLIAVLPGAAHAAPLKNTLEVSGWIPYWRSATGTQDVLPNITALTAVHPFGYIVTNEGVVSDPVGFADEPWKSLRAAAVANKVRVIPTVMWSDGASMQRILSSAPLRQKLEDDIAALAVREGFDGIDIDFENKYAETRPYFSLFLKGLYQRMGTKWVYCTIESRTPISSRYDGTPPKDAGVYANDFVEINKYCDRVQIMAYDQGTIDLKLNATAAGPYVPIADTAWVEKVMNVAAQSISKRKLVLGIPTYGYEYTVTPLATSGYRYDRLWAFNPRYATDLAMSLGINPVRNSAGELQLTYIATSTPTVAGVPTSAAAAGPAAAGAQTINILSWSDSTAIAQKIALAKKLGIRGIALFKLDGGEDPNVWNLIK